MKNVAKMLVSSKRIQALVPKTKQLPISVSMQRKLEVPWLHKQIVFEVLMCFSISMIFLRMWFHDEFG